MTHSIDDTFDPTADPGGDGWGIEELLSVDTSGMSAGEALAFAEAIGQMQAMLHAQRLRACRRYRVATGHDEWAHDALAARLKTSIHRAGTEMALADDLIERLPRTLAAMDEGRLDDYRARQIAEAAEPLDGDQCAELEDRLFPAATDQPPQRLRQRARRAVAAIDPDAATTRARRARGSRRVELDHGEDGVSWLNLCLPSEVAAAAFDRIDSLARQANSDGDVRTLDQMRADVAAELLLGTNQQAMHAQVYVTAGASTLLGLDELPGELRGCGPLPAERVRELAYDLKATWSGLLTDDTGQPAALARDRYRFTGRLAEFVRLRDETCRHPACHKPAHRCDIDHRVPYPHGPTTAANAQVLCRRHHRQKHSSPTPPTGQPEDDPPPF
ncbi:DUF222 domain-containing protein [Haloechinothrix sp. LS1_15]|uniref:HNH endonuclease signature motif containing protein n=1 Tax=Haloechinothrix sp. LS1_15 TaxID=2652248 RepID=UPI00294792C0|nr:DUF222 domain-containing protein [Haloechinothrix sp. LS1_15]MDV6013770.1 DUF222 domain-containing protein [Haloechinothrix sp. LS1_15]